MQISNLQHGIFQDRHFPNNKSDMRYRSIQWKANAESGNVIENATYRTYEYTYDNIQDRFLNEIVPNWRQQTVPIPSTK